MGEEFSLMHLAGDRSDLLLNFGHVRSANYPSLIVRSGLIFCLGGVEVNVRYNLPMIKSGNHHSIKVENLAAAIRSLESALAVQVDPR